MNISGIILAGGASRRMGAPKALLEYKGERFLDRLIRIFSTSCDAVTVVLGAEADRIRAGATAGDYVRFVVNADWPLGQLTSLQTGLSAIRGSSDAVLFTPVDYPAIELETAAAVCTGWRTGSDRPMFVRPRYRGKHGHPVLFDSQLIDEFLAVPADGQARDVVHKYVDQTLYVDVDDPGICNDVDDRAAYERLVGTPVQSS